MSVSITFEPTGISGVVAQGTYLIDAARRMGASLGEGCTAGKGDCPSCVVSVKSGRELLSTPSAAEEKYLGAENLDHGYRLACQAKIENHGDVVVMLSVAPPRSDAPPVDRQAELRRTFGALPLGKKLATLVQLEAITMSETFDAAIEKPLAFGSKTFGAIFDRARAKSDAAKQNK
jgi:2Fe-2S ferredoxin